MLKIMPFVAETLVKNNAICGRNPQLLKRMPIVA
jgi:hypothetical protein